MTTNIKFFQGQQYFLTGGGANIGDVAISVQSLTDILGNFVTMTPYFGTKGWFSVSQGTSSERQVSFTGITQNTNGTATLTGLKTVQNFSPYTETAGLDFPQAGGATLVFSNNPGLYDTFANKDNDGVITALWQFTAGQNPAYLSQPVSFGPLDLIDFQFLVSGTYDYFVDTGTVNNIVITPSPSIGAYAAGQRFFIKVKITNTGPTTININGLGPKSLKKQVTVDLDAGDILTNQIILVDYDGVNFQLIGSGGGGAGVGAGIVTRSARGSFTLAPATTVVIDTEGTSGSNAGNLMTETGGIKNLYINSESNTFDGATVYTLLRNGVPTSVTVTVPAGVNGILQDITDSFSVSGGDLIALSCDTTASSSGSGKVSFSYQVGGGGTDVQTFTTPGANTWTKPSGAKVVKVVTIGAGGGGGSGSGQNSPAVNISGGGGGGGGGIQEEIFDASLLGATETATVGTGGAGGVAPISNNNGNPGSNGGVSSFGTWLQSGGGGGGAGGTASSATLGGASGGSFGSASGTTRGTPDSGAATDGTESVDGGFNSKYGGGGGATSGLGGGTASDGGSSIIAAGGGGGGGGEGSSGGAKGVGGAGGKSNAYTVGGGGTAGSNSAGGNGASNATAKRGYGGSGGGGGTPNGDNVSNAFAGGNGGLPGGGGGGGGATSNGALGAAGGNGGDGTVIVITYF